MLATSPEVWAHPRVVGRTMWFVDQLHHITWGLGLEIHVLRPHPQRSEPGTLRAEPSICLVLRPSGASEAQPG